MEMKGDGDGEGGRWKGRGWGGGGGGEIVGCCMGFEKKGGSCE